MRKIESGNSRSTIFRPIRFTRRRALFRMELRQDPLGYASISNASLPDLSGDDGALFAFAHLAASAKYLHPFLVNPSPLEFFDSKGRKTDVASFGLSPSRKQNSWLARQQVRILYAAYAGRVATEFALDLSAGSQPYQIVIAIVNPQKHWRYTGRLQNKMIRYKIWRRSLFDAYGWVTTRLAARRAGRFLLIQRWKVKIGLAQ